MTDNVVTVRDLHKTYQRGQAENHVLRGLDFSVAQGEFVAVMGPSGCGKSTLLYLIGGLEKPTSGQIITCGSDLSRLGDRAQSRIRTRDVGFVFQFYNLVQNLSVEENVLLPVALSGRSVAKFRPKAMELLRMMGLESKRREIPSRLSGGQQQRVSIARAVIGGPRLVLADEPTGNLDSRSGREVLDMFRTVNETMGVSVIMVTHSEEAAASAGRILRMQDGVILSDERK